MWHTVITVRWNPPKGTVAEVTGEPSGRRVLVVEDDPASRRALVSLLNLSGFETIFASNLSEAIAQLDTGPHCVLLDLMLPDGTGGAVLEFIRSQRLPIKVAITTGTADWRNFVSGSTHRPDAIFIKPLDFDSISRWLVVA